MLKFVIDVILPIIIITCYYNQIQYLHVLSLEFMPQIVTFSFSMLCCVVILLLSCSISSSFIIGTSKGFHVSHDKTLSVRFGYPRREKQNCKFKLQIDYLSEETQHDEEEQDESEDVSLYSGQFYCYQMSPRQPFVYKHTPGKYEYSGSYRVCVQNLEDFNPQQNNTMFQLQIAQKFDPTLMLDTMQVPLVGSSQIIELQAMVTSIKRTLSWCQVHVKEAEEVGYKLIQNLIKATDAGYKATYIQIIFLVVYGIIWVIVMRNLYK